MSELNSVKGMGNSNLCINCSYVSKEPEPSPNIQKQYLVDAICVEIATYYEL